MHRNFDQVITAVFKSIKYITAFSKSIKHIIAASNSIKYNTRIFIKHFTYIKEIHTASIRTQSDVRPCDNSNEPCLKIRNCCHKCH